MINDEHGMMKEEVQVWETWPNVPPLTLALFPACGRPFWIGFAFS
jgi:hypothetical protein